MIGALRFAALAFGASACIDALGPTVGPPLPDASGIAACGEDSDPTTPVSFSRDLLDGVFRRACARCHDAGGEGAGNSGLDLSSYARVRAGGTRSGASIVVPNRPCDSILVQKLEAAPPFGDRMPKGDGPLSAPDLALVRDWIFEGANDN